MGTFPVNGFGLDWGMGDPNSPFDRLSLYRDYPAHKQWVGWRPDDTDRFTNKLRKINLPPAATILEVGFGEGRFLDWARSRGYSVEGIEIIPEMAQRASSNGHIAHVGAISKLTADGQRFDLIAAFDVIEHLTHSEISDFFEDADRVLKARGRILLQFPNAGSPFSALYQSGDATHETALSKEFLEQILRPRGWVVSECFNARVSSTNPIKQIKWWLRHFVRDVIEVIVCFAYFGSRQPLDPNIVVVLNRNPSSTT